jgi:carboxyl-terminal processing protease
MKPSIPPQIRAKTAPSWQPVAYAAVLILGVYIGLSSGTDSTGTFVPGSSRNALNGVLDRVEKTYVDPVMREELEQVALDAILKELDPHTLFFSSKELAEMAEPMEGNFEGIGVEFIIQDDTLMVVAAIPGGPAEKAGVLAGDRILEVDSIPISGSELDNRKVMELLKGPRNTKVRVGVPRGDGLEQIVLKRDRIPIHSVVSAFAIDSVRGYIKVVRFAQNTAQEFEEAMVQLERAGLKQVIVDLRGNGGGYLNAVVPMVEAFLDKGQLVVYTEGEHVPKRTYKARNDGRWQDWDVAVLVDESSASASEIFAGAMQDHDRGIIVGRRTFGKGLVQEEFSISDLGALRLTVARFYTPTGRAIQKPYGSDVDYGDDYFMRYERGELFEADSMLNTDTDSLDFRTQQGKIVKSLGGITPDVFVPLDTSGMSSLMSKLSWSGVLRDAAFSFVDAHRSNWFVEDKEPENPEIWTDAGWNHLMNAAREGGFDIPTLRSSERSLLKQRFASQVLRNASGESAFHEYSVQFDQEFQKAIYWLKNTDAIIIIDGQLSLQLDNNKH